MYQAPQNIRCLFDDPAKADFIFGRLGFDNSLRLSAFKRVIASLSTACEKAVKSGGVFASGEFVALSEQVSELNELIDAVDPSVNRLGTLDDDEGHYFKQREYPLLRFFTEPIKSKLHARLVGFSFYALLKSQRENRLGDFNTASGPLSWATLENKKSALIPAHQKLINNLFDSSLDFVDLRDSLLTEIESIKRKRSFHKSGSPENQALSNLNIDLRHLQTISEHVLLRSATWVPAVDTSVLTAWQLESAPCELSASRVAAKNRGFLNVDSLFEEQVSVTTAVEPADILGELEISGGDRLIPGEQQAKENQAHALSRRWVGRKSALLPFNKELYDDEELESLFEEVAKALASDEKEEQIAALLIQLSLCLARSPEELSNIVIGQDILPDGSYKKRVVEHEEAVQLKDHEKHRFHAKAECLYLCLPTALVKGLEAFGLKGSESNPVLLTEFFNISSTEINSLTRNLLKRVRDSGNDRVIYNNVHTQFRNYYTVHSQDLCSGFLLFNTPAEGAPVQLFYRSISAYTLEKQFYDYINAFFDDHLSPSLNQERENLYVGSNLRFKKQVFIEELSRLKMMIAPPPREAALKELVNYHNLYTAYTTLLLLYSTGHRPVIDPFCFIEDIDRQNGLVVINDKNTIELHKNRVSILAEVAKEQLNYYFKHIKALAQRIRKLDKESKVPQHIYSLLESNIAPENQAIPLLFFLTDDGAYQEVSPSQIRKILGDLLLFEDNQQRHYLETVLHEMGANPKAIDHQLGHIVDGQHHLSNTHTWSLKAIREHLSPYLQNALSELGFESIKGLKCPEHEFDINPCYRKHGGKAEFGPETRERERREKNCLIKESVQEIVKSHTVVNKKKKDDQKLPRILTTEAQKKIREDIDAIFVDAPEAKKKAHFLFTRYCSYSNYMNGLYAYSSYKTYHLINNNPVKNDWLRQFKLGEKISNSFVSYLSDNATNPVDANIRWAEIIVSSVIAGGIFRKSWAEKLILMTPDDLHRLSNRVFLEIKVKDEHEFPDWRYHPDPQTLKLIQGLNKYQKKHSEEIFEYCPKSIEKNIYEICKRIGVPGRGRKKILENLCSISSSYSFYHMPGYIHAIISGQLSYTPLSFETYARLILGEHVKVKSPAKSPIDYVEVTPHTKVESGIFPQYDDREVYRLITKIFNEAAKYKSKHADKYSTINKKIRQENPPNEIKDELKGERDNLKHKIRRDRLGFLAFNLKFLIGMELNQPHYVIKKLEINRQRSLSNNSRKVCEWLIDYCESRLKSTDGVPKVSTPLRYFSCLKPIFYNSYGDIQFMEDYELQETYQDIIDQVSDKKKLYRAQRLKSFHNFLIRYGANPMSWSLLEGVNWKERNIANANLVTESEYKDILSAIDAFDFSEYEKLWISGLIIIGYRFGFRISEALNLRYSDVHIRADGSVNVYMRNHREDIGKSRNAVRKTVSWSLSANEIKILDSLKVRLEKIASIDKKYQRSSNSAYIFCKEQKIKEQLDKKKAASLITSILRSVCCDPRLTFHHLRHSLANNLFNMLLIEEDASYQKALLASEGFDYRQLKAISRMLGHGSPSTTLGNYIHIVEDHLRVINESNVNRNIDKGALMYIHQQTKSGVERVNRQKKIKRYELYKNLTSGVYIKHLTPSLEREGVELVECEGSLDFNEGKTNKELNLWDLDRLCRIYAIQQRSDNLSDIFSISELFVDEIIESGIDCECNTRFEMFAFSGKRRKTWKEIILSPKLSSFSREIDNLERFYEKSQSIINQLTDENYRLICNGLSAWRAAYKVKKSDNALFFTEPDSLSSFLELMDLLKIPRGEFQATLPSGVSDDSTKNYTEFLEHSGIERVYQAAFRGLSENTDEPRVKVSLAKNSIPLNYQASLNRFLFILTMCLNVRDKVHADL